MTTVYHSNIPQKLRVEYDSHAIRSKESVAAELPRESKQGEDALEGASCLSVLIPAYNEEGTIEFVLRRVLELGVILKEVIVVDDGSTDRTATVVENIAAEEPLVRFFRLPQNQGKTAAIREAIEHATGEILIIQDADLEYDPREIPAVIEPILAGQADVVYGSRFLIRKAARVLYFYHYLANKFLTFLSNLLTNRNMTDIETCYKAFRAEAIKPLRLTSKGFGMEVEITALICKTKTRTYEVPISYYGRSYEEGKKIGLMDGLSAIWYILYFNLIKPRLREGRRYVESVNSFLAADRARSPAKKLLDSPRGQPLAP